MGYYISVWDGSAPLSNAHANSEFRRRRALDPELPGPGLEQFLSSLLTADILDFPSVTEPAHIAQALADCVDGGVLLLPVQTDDWDRALDVLLHEADRGGLVLFDPQRGELLPSAVFHERRVSMSLPAREQLEPHLKALVAEATKAPHPMIGVLEDDSTGYYVQWITEDGGLVVEAQGDDVVLPALKLTKEERSAMFGIGFTDGDPNWITGWEPGSVDAAAAANAMTSVLYDIRQFEPGRWLTLNTFPRSLAEN
jgi:hypothetical protein